MPDFEQVQAHLGSIVQLTQSYEPIKRRRDSALAVAASGVLSDPNWKVYADHLEALKQRFEKIMEGHKQTLLGSQVYDFVQYAQLKADQAYAKAYIQAMTDAIDMIKTLVDKPNTP